MLTRRLRLVWFLEYRNILNRAMWFGAVTASAVLALAPAVAQGPPGAAAAAAGAAAEATVAAPAPAPKKTAASAAAEAAAEGNSAVAPHNTQTAAPPRNTEEAANGGALAGNAVTPEKSAPAPVLTGVAAQCADLLKLATDLKAEVGKTTKDELSVPVVRDAGQIEHLARKMRDQQH